MKISHLYSTSEALKFLPGAKEGVQCPIEGWALTQQLEHGLAGTLLFPREGASLPLDVIAGGKRSLWLAQGK